MGYKLKLNSMTLNDLARSKRMLIIRWTQRSFLVSPINLLLSFKVIHPSMLAVIALYCIQLDYRKQYRHLVASAACVIFSARLSMRHYRQSSAVRVVTFRAAVEMKFLL